jgi:hypothetical protein
MALALAPLHGRVIPSTSEEAPGLLASVEHSLEAQHFPDVLHGQPELVQAVSGPMATKERAAHQAVTEATAQRERRQHDPQSLGEEVDKRRAGRAPTAPSSLEHAAQALDAAPCEHQRLAEPRHLVQASLRGMGQDDHCVDLERGVRRHGPRIVSDLSGHLAQMRTVAQQAGLSQSCVERLKKAARVGPKMHATLECVSGSGHTQVRQRDWTPDVSFAMHAKLIPSWSLDRVAQTRTVSDGEPLRERAERLRTPLLQPRGVWSA